MQKYRKSALTTARLLTQQDIEERRGVIHTLEGPVPFEIGDYLAVGVNDEEWPIKAETMQHTKMAISVPDEFGFVKYTSTNIVLAEKQAHDFQVNLEHNGTVLTGKAGDYLVQDFANPQSKWVVDGEIFKKTYTASD